MKEIKILKYGVGLLILTLCAICAMVGMDISKSDRIECLESIIAVCDSLQAYKEAATQRDFTIKAWQSTAYNILAFNAGDIDADSMLSVLQSKFKPGSPIIDFWLRSVSLSKGTDENTAGKEKRN